MPIVKCDKDLKVCEKKYEIEKEELIFTKKTTDKTNKLVKAKKYQELGEYLQKEILDNTHSFTEKYKELN